jgi:hypothetical protein
MQSARLKGALLILILQARNDPHAAAGGERWVVAVQEQA